MAEPVSELEALKSRAKRAGYRLEPASNGGWLVTGGGLRPRRFASRWRLASDASLVRLLKRILDGSKVGCGYAQKALRRGPVRPVVTADKGDPWAKPRRRGSFGIFDLPVKIAQR